jgi:hypothetical protein
MNKGLNSQRTHIANMQRKKADKSHRGNASQFFVAGELCRRGYAAVVTMGNCPNTDILCSNKEGTKFVHIQVKTFRPGDKDCSIGMKAEINYGPNFFWILAGIPEPGSDEPFSYFVVPSSIMAKNVAECHERWHNTPGARGQQRNETTFRSVELFRPESPYYWDVTSYLNHWELVEKKLRD